MHPEHTSIWVCISLTNQYYVLGIIWWIARIQGIHAACFVFMTHTESWPHSYPDDKSSASLLPLYPVLKWKCQRFLIFPLSKLSASTSWKNFSLNKLKRFSLVLRTQEFLWTRKPTHLLRSTIQKYKRDSCNF